MRISVNTETEEIEELRHAVAIIEDAIKRRENPDLYEDETQEEYKKEAEQEKKVELKQPEQPQPEKIAVETPKVEEVKPQLNVKVPELNLTQPMSYSQVQQVHQAQKPMPIPSRREERGTTQDIDISALSMSNYGEAREGRKMDGITRSSSMSPSPPSSSSFSGSSQSSSMQQPRGFEPRPNNESAVKDIINSLRQRSGQPIQMSDIISKARTRSISEQETRSLVSKLQREGTI